MGLLRFRCAAQLILDYDLKDVIKANARAPEKPIWNEIEENQRRVVEVHGLPKTWTLRDVTHEATEGPLMHVSLWDAST